jgi:hypothetical protein
VRCVCDSLHDPLRTTLVVRSRYPSF